MQKKWLTLNDANKEKRLMSIAYKQGGYEAKSSNVTPEAEGILMGAIRKLLKN